MVDNSTRVMTAALAIIKIDGIAVGRMKNIRVTENFSRSNVVGLGNIVSQEKPIVGWSGTCSCSTYTIDLKRIGNVSSSKFGLNREAGDANTFINSLLLNEKGIDICIYKKFAQTIDNVTGLVSAVGDGEFCVIGNAFPNSQNFDIQEGSISGSDISFDYLNPILFDQAAQ